MNASSRATSGNNLCSTDTCRRSVSPTATSRAEIRWAKRGPDGAAPTCRRENRRRLRRSCASSRCGGGAPCARAERSATADRGRRCGCSTGSPWPPPADTRSPCRPAAPSGCPPCTVLKRRTLSAEPCPTAEVRQSASANRRTWRSERLASRSKWGFGWELKLRYVQHDRCT